MPKQAHDVPEQPATPGSLSFRIYVCSQCGRKVRVPVFVQLHPWCPGCVQRVVGGNA
jgi:hypothetical protein